MRLYTAFCSLWLIWLTLVNADEPKIICYYASWAVWRNESEKVEISDIDPTLCTHLVYAFVGITDDGDVQVLHPQFDLPDNTGQTGFQKLNALRKRNEKLKIFVSTGGWDEGPVTYSKVAADPALRSKYVKNVVDFMRRHQFDGFDIFRQWPTVEGGSLDDVQNYVLLLKELRMSFDEHKFILSIQVEGSEEYARRYDDIPEISKYVDLILLWMNCHGPMDRITGHSAPLYHAARETSTLSRSLNTNTSVHYWLKQGVPADKLILGTRFFGISYILKNSADHAPGSSASGPAESGLGLGYMGYKEICKLTSQDAWTSVWDEEQRVPYIHSGNRWISYDNVRSLTEKGEYVQSMGLGGVMAWSVDIDDHRGECGERFPLLNALNRGLRESGSSLDSSLDLTSEEPTSAKLVDRKMPISTLPSVGAKIVCYYQSWAIDRIGYTRIEPSDIDPRLCTHLVYSSVGITEDGSIEVFFPRNDLPDNGGRAGFEKFNALRKRNERLKTLVSGGDTSPGYANFLNVIADTSLRSNYVKNVVDFVLLHKFDGFDLLWESSTIDEDEPDVVQNWVLVVKELRARFDQHKLILSISVIGSEWFAQGYHDISQISKYVDFVLLGVQSHRARDPTTGHSAPLYSASRETTDFDLSLNVNASVHYWLDQGVPADKLILETRFYGISFTLNNSAEHLPGSSAVGPTPSILGSGLIGYNEICRLISLDGWTTAWDEEQRVPYAYSGDRWISYDNVRSLTEKVEYVRDLGLGGVMTLYIDMDDNWGGCGKRYPLLNALARGFRQSDSTSVSTPKTSRSIGANIVCYYPNAAETNVGYARLKPSDIDPSLCTHLIYASVGVTGDGDLLVMRPRVDLPDDGGSAGFQQVNALRKQNEGLKTLVSCGGSGQSSMNYSKIAADGSLRSKYAKNVVDFVLRHEFDGVDIDWQYPTGGGDPDDIQNFVLLLKELRTSFDEHDLILWITAAGSQVLAQTFYDIPGISKYAHHILLDIKCHTPFEQTTAHSAPLYAAAREVLSLDRSLNIHAAIEYWLYQGAPAKKLILSTRFFGIGFNLNNSLEHEPGSLASGPTALAYKFYAEMCRLVPQDAWTTVWDKEQHVPYSYSGDQWISYDNVRSLTEKAKYVQNMGLGGVMASSINLDDHQGACGKRFPLLRALNRRLRSPSSDSIPEDSMPVNTARVNVTTTSKPELSNFSDEDAKKICVMYDYKYVRHPKDCAKFWICRKIEKNDLKAEPFSCGSGLYFDTSNNICESKNSVQCS